MSKRVSRSLTFGLLGLAVTCVGVAWAVTKRAPSAGAGPATVATTVAPAASELREVPSRSCAGAAPAVTAATPAGRAGNPAARRAAQQGLDFLARAAPAWQKKEGCYGCHVQAVTLEAMAVGRRNQYRLAAADLESMVSAMLSLPGGARSAGGFQYRGGQLLQPSKAFGGAALARYDASIDAKLSNDLLRTAGELLTYQRQDGAYDMKYDHTVVSVGDIQGTYLAIFTWKQAYERSADEKWLGAVRRAERFLQTAASTLEVSQHHGLQRLNYTLLGLVEAGVGATEQVPTAVRRKLLAAQGQDGGWALAASGPSSAYATGQTLYALRAAGMTDADGPIRSGARWLIEKQQSGGAWSRGGSEKAEAMWGVLGLVTLDVITVALTDLHDGQHVAPGYRIHARGADNKGGAVRKMELAIDDIRVASHCGGELELRWPRGLGEGKHVAIISAENSRGEVSRRRIDLYTGNVYLTDAATQFGAAGTVISARNIAPATQSTRVRLEVLATDEKTGLPVAGRPLTAEETTGKQGPLQLAWKGKDGAGRAAKGGRYVARLKVLDAGGKVLQTADVPFVHDTLEQQRARYAEVEGKLDLGGGQQAENAQVQLVDKDGRVVAEARSTRAGQYKFRNVRQGSYKIRVQKSGYAGEAAAPVVAAPGRKAQADIQVRRK